MTFTTGDFHDTKVLDEIADFVFAADDNTKILQRLMSLERGHVKYRDNRCINLIAAEAPTSPLVRKCLSSSFGYRASGGHIGKTSRCFPGMYSEKLASANIMTNKMLTPYDKDCPANAATAVMPECRQPLKFSAHMWRIINASKMPPDCLKCIESV